MSLIIDSLRKSLSEPRIDPMTPAEETWWRETRQMLQRRRRWTAATKAAGVLGMMALLKVYRLGGVAVDLREVLFAIPFALFLFAVFTGLFSWQGGKEIEAEQKRRLIARRMHQDILSERESEYVDSRDID